MVRTSPQARATLLKRGNVSEVRATMHIVSVGRFSHAITSKSRLLTYHFWSRQQDNCTKSTRSHVSHPICGLGHLGTRLYFRFDIGVRAAFKSLQHSKSRPDRSNTTAQHRQNELHRRHIQHSRSVHFHLQPAFDSHPTGSSHHSQQVSCDRQPFLARSFTKDRG